MPLDPLIVYPRDGRYVVIDGHHRLRAYKEVRWARVVPVRIFDGSLQEARDAAFIANSRGQRPYSSRERLEKAWYDTKRWHFDEVKELTKEQTARRAGVSDGLVGKMRRTVKRRGEEVRELSWSETLRGAREHEPDPEWQHKKALEVQEALLAVKGVKYLDSPEILAEAIEAISPLLAASLVREWPDIALEVAEQYELNLEEEQAEIEAGRLPRI